MNTNTHTITNKKKILVHFQNLSISLWKASFQGNNHHWKRTIDNKALFFTISVFLIIESLLEDNLDKFISQLALIPLKALTEDIKEVINHLTTL